MILTRSMSEFLASRKILGKDFNYYFQNSFYLFEFDYFFFFLENFVSLLIVGF